MDIIKTIDMMVDMISDQYKLSREDSMRIVTFALGTSYVFKSLDDKIGRLIDEGFLKGKMMPFSEI